MLRNKFYLKMGGNLSSLVTYNVLKIDRFISFDKLVKLLFMAILFQRYDKFWHGVDTAADDMVRKKIKSRYYITKQRRGLSLPSVEKLNYSRKEKTLF